MQEVVEKIEMSKENRFVPQAILEKSILAKEFKDAEVHPLLVEAERFDFTYEMSDSGDVWRGGEARKRELFAKVDADEILTTEEKIAIKQALDSYTGHSMLLKRFPQINGLRYTDSDERIISYNTKEWEMWIEDMRSKLDELEKVFELTDFSACTLTGIVWSPNARRCYGDFQNISGKTTLSPASQQIINTFCCEVTKEEIAQYYHIESDLSGYVLNPQRGVYEHVDPLATLAYRGTSGRNTLTIRKNRVSLEFAY